MPPEANQNNQQPEQLRLPLLEGTGTRWVVVGREGNRARELAQALQSVSYTHLTLPTNREV